MILDGASVGGPLDLEVDVCVVGAGAGGAVVACALAEAGLSVVVLEEGRDDTDGGGLIAGDSRWRGLGWQATADRGIRVLQGLGPGGSSERGSALARRAPEDAVERWSERGVAMFRADALAAAYAEVERRVPPGEPRGDGSHPIEAAARDLGLEHRRLSGEDADDLPGTAAGEPAPDRSVRRTWVDWADRAGARLLCGFRVEGLELEAGPLVRALTLERGAVRHPVVVRAPAVVLAAGAVHTPALMMWSRLPNPHRRIGHGLRLQPTAPLISRFDEPPGALHGPRIEVDLPGASPPDTRARSAALSPVEIARQLPLHGPELTDVLGSTDRLAPLLVTLRDRRSGWVVPMTESHAVIRYELAPGDRRRLRIGLEEAARLLLAAGAREIWTSHARPTVIRGEGDLGLLRDRDYLACDLALTSTTPLGTCAAGADPRESVVGEGGRFHGAEGVYVADASLIPDPPGVPLGHTVAALALGVAEAVVSDLGRSGG